MRAYIILVIAIGFFGSLVTSFSADRSPSSRRTEFIGTNTDPPEAADSSTSSTPPPSDSPIELKREGNGHFYADVEINGSTTHMLVDTGATVVALSREDARRAGIADSVGMPNVVGQGADGSVHGEFATIDHMALGDKTAEKVDAIVLDRGVQSLLGQSFLRQFASVEIHGDTMVLR